ncbi:FecR domain-containing protein [Devosia sp.]|uniref:FecR domain-containing protein n=1 Tax=Devosia sp. TaxID=1871048 RepID=UPI002FC900FA
MRKRFVSGTIVSIALIMSPAGAVADDWTAVRLRGGVFALENGAWVQLFRGSVVPDDRVIKSAPDGRITLVRGQETIEFGPDTTAQIADSAGFTTVYNHAGTVGVDAEARNVQHFAVQTSYLAAIVKGTAFTVATSEEGSTVAVARGVVAVADTRADSSVYVEAGQQVSTGVTPIAFDNIIARAINAPAPPAPAATQPNPSASLAQGQSGENVASAGSANGNAGGSLNNGNGNDKSGGVSNAGGSGGESSGRGGGNAENGNGRGSENGNGNGNGNGKKG